MNYQEESFDIEIEYTVQKKVTVYAATEEEAREEAPQAAALAFAVPVQNVRVIT